MRKGMRRGVILSVPTCGSLSRRPATNYSKRLAQFALVSTKRRRLQLLLPSSGNAGQLPCTKTGLTRHAVSPVKPYAFR